MFAVCALFLVAFAWFGFHAVPSLYFGDNGELLAAIQTGGIPHPTGFPSLLLLGYYPSQLHTFAVNLTSSAAGALAVALLAFWARRLFGRNAFLPTAIFLLGSTTLLLHSSMTRIYSFQLATMAAVLVAVALFQPHPRWGLLFGFLLGLSATTHTLFLGAIVVALVLLWDRRKSWSALAPWVFLGSTLALSLYLWIPLRAHLNPEVSWGSPSHFDSLWSYLSQKQYSNKMASRDLLGTWLFIRDITGIFLREWNPLIWIFALWGAYLTYISARRKAFALGSLMVFNIGLLFLYGHNQDLDILYRYFLPTYACAAVFASVAAVKLWERWTSLFAKRLSVQILLGIVFLALFVAKPARQWADLSDSVGCRSYLFHLLKPLPKDATAVLMGDNQVFPAAYGRYNLGLRRDLHIVEYEGTLFPEAYRLLHNPQNPKTVVQLEEAWYEKGGGSLYVASPRMVQPPDHCRPFGFMYRLSDDASEQILPPSPRPDWLPPRFTSAEQKDREASEPLAEHYLMSSAWKRHHEDKEGALKDVEDALRATPRTIRTLINASAFFGEANMDERCEALLRQALSINPKNFEATLNLGIHYGKTTRYDECLRYLNLANGLQPNHPVVLHYLRQLNAVAR
jgi:tetratricopeptide (TPR) repeat protein